MVLVYVISFIVGGFISFILYDKVPVIVSLIIATMVGGLIGYIYNRIQRKKAEREYVEWMKRAGFINLGEGALTRAHSFYFRVKNMFLYEN